MTVICRVGSVCLCFLLRAYLVGLAWLVRRRAVRYNTAVYGVVLQVVCGTRSRKQKTVAVVTLGSFFS